MSPVTKRFDLEQATVMLGAAKSEVRSALLALDKLGELSAETFVFAGGAWRIAPSDLERVGRYLAAKRAAAAGAESGCATSNNEKFPAPRRVVRRAPGDGAR
jgi:hypothetical protein